MHNFRQSGKIKALFLVNLVFLLMAAAYYLLSTHDPQKFDVSIDDWKSEHAVYRNNGLSVDPEIKDSGEETVFLWGPYIPLKRGSYSAKINYSADADQTCNVTASYEEAELLDSSDGILYSPLHDIVYRFEAKDDIKEFQLLVKYSGKGDFTIHSINIVSDNNRAKRISVEILAAALLIDLVFLFFRQDRDDKKIILALCGITFLGSLPLMMYGIHGGHDIYFHFLRIEAIVQALRSGQFPARISLISLFGFGYPFSIYYPDVFIYEAALLRLAGFSVTAAYKLYLLTVNIVTVLISYWSFKKIFKNRDIGVLLTLLYVTASYRLVNGFIRAAVGEYTAQAFLPLLALAFYRIYDNGPKTKRRIIADSILLAAAMSGLIGSHILTTLMACFLMVIICLAQLKKTLRKETILTFVIGAGLSVLLNLYFLVPFVDYYYNVPTVIRNIVEEETKMIQRMGLFPAQLFGFFQDLDGWTSDWHGIVNMNINERMQTTPGLPLMMILLAAVVIRLLSMNKQKFDLLLLMSLLTLWLASDIFPWTWLTLHFPPWKLLSQIEFPIRFLVFSILFLTLLSGCILKENIPYIKTAALCTAVFMALWGCGNLFNTGRQIYIYDTSGMVPNSTGFEYLIDGSTLDKVNTDLNTENMNEVKVLSANSNTVTLYCSAGDGQEDHVVDVPVYFYKGYHVFDQDKNEYEIKAGDQNRITFSLPDGFDGKITVTFRDPVYWRLALWISGITMIFVIILGFLSVNKKKKLCPALNEL